MVRKMSTRLGRASIVAVLIVMSAVVTTWGSGRSRFDARRSVPKSAPHQPTFYDAPGPYDLDAIQVDPAGYYGRSVPSRAWQIAPLPPGRKQHEELLIVGQRFRFVAANDPRPVPLSVRAKPCRPVTFTALDSGRFANGRISITVPADQDGCAKVDFWVGDVGDFRVLAGSPENHGPAEFTLQALLPSELHDLESGEYAKKYRASFNGKAGSRGDAAAKRVVGTLRVP
jgi:hypothetical protein